MPAERADAVKAFARAYVRRLSINADGASAEELAGEIVSAFEFASARGPEEIAVRAFNPRRDRDGYETAGSVLETNTRDLPFLVDSVTGELGAWSVGIARVLHPIIGTERDEEGRIVHVVSAREALSRESVIHFELDRRLDEDGLADLAAAVHSVLCDVLKVVGDFPEMIERVGDMEELADAATARYPQDEIEEAALFLRWLRQGNFVFLGYRSTRSPRAGSASRPARAWACCATRAPPPTRAPSRSPTCPRACASASSTATF